jgi:hypothetical protein
MAVFIEFFPGLVFSFDSLQHGEQGEKRRATIPT